MQANRIEDIMLIFLQTGRNELTDDELSTAIRNHGKQCSSEEVRAIVQTFGSSLFRCRHSEQNIFFIRTEPSISICQEFLNGKCKFKASSCNKLHLCRRFGACTRKDCPFPHDLNRPDNQSILQQLTCHSIDQRLLVHFLQLHQRLLNFSFKAVHYSPASSACSAYAKPADIPPLLPEQKSIIREFGPTRQNRVRSGRRQKHTVKMDQGDIVNTTATGRTSLSDDCRVNVNFPLISASLIKCDDIVTFLKSKGFQVGNISNSKQDAYFQQYTLTCADKSVADKILALSTVLCNNVTLRFKRTNPSIDRKSFLLQSTIDPTRGIIKTEKYSLYIDVLLQNGTYKLTDLSTVKEQVFLIQCYHEIDFNNLSSIQKSRAQLQGTPVFLKQVYELDTILIESTHLPLSIEIIENMFNAVFHNIFKLSILSSQMARVEFINTTSLSEWLSVREAIEKRFEVHVKIDVKCVSDKSCVSMLDHSSDCLDATASTESNQSSKKTFIDIEVGPNQQHILKHPQFSKDYKSYINLFESLESFPKSSIRSVRRKTEDENCCMSAFFCQKRSPNINQEDISNQENHDINVICKETELGLDVDINERRVQLFHEFTNDTDKQEMASRLRKATNQFLSQFTFNIVNLDQASEQIKLLEAHASSVCFIPSKDSKYKLIAKTPDMENIKSKLFPKPPTPSSPSNAATATNSLKIVDQQVSPALTIPLPVSNTISAENTSSAVSKTETVVKSLFLPSNNESEVALFRENTVQNFLKDYFLKKFSTKLTFKVEQVNNRFSVNLSGSQGSMDRAMEELSNILTSCRTKTFQKTKDNVWVKIPDAVHVVQHQLRKIDILCVCEQRSAPISILIHYIDKESVAFSTNENEINTICQRTCWTMVGTVTGFEQEWIRLRTQISLSAEYKKNICFLEENCTVTFYGLPNNLKAVQRQLETERKKCAALNTAATPTTEKTVVHETTTDKSNNSPLATEYYSVEFEIDEPGFDDLITSASNRISAIVGSMCRLEKIIIKDQIQIGIPRAKAQPIDNSKSPTASPETKNEVNSIKPCRSWIQNLLDWNQSKTKNSQVVKEQCLTDSPSQTASSIGNAATITVHKPRIVVCTGDLTKQAVDLIVVCSTSRFLCDSILDAAGEQVKSSFRQLTSSGTQSCETAGGNLPCKQIAFRPLITDQCQPQDLKFSVQKFVSSSITYALQHNLKTIALPSVGCGRFGYDPMLIAEYMIDEAHELLTRANHAELVVSFVLMADQSHVYNAFINRLKTVESTENVFKKVSFDKQTVRIKLIGTDRSHVIECEQKIRKLAQSCSAKLNLTDKIDLAEWPQETIDRYYEYCLQRRVIPTLNIQNTTLHLIGPKTAVADAEKHYLQLSNEVLRNARIRFVPSEFVWSVEVSPGQWEQYSANISQEIENAYAKKSAQVDFDNDKFERCRVIFSSMTEECQNRKRKVSRRKLINSPLPTHWDVSDNNFKRAVLHSFSQEYQKVLAHFDKTMKGRYTKIVKIERIQNERWYKQYAAHYDEFKQRYRNPDERLLFHGCSHESADKIVKECFNRTFAGVNGTSFGQGVYFHEHANYSHCYTKPNFSNERTMFLAHVLIGKTCTGNPSMKVPPEGYDTTTDGRHIFVVYHDAAAYGDYLITYT